MSIHVSGAPSESGAWAGPGRVPRPGSEDFEPWMIAITVGAIAVLLAVIGGSVVALLFTFGSTTCFFFFRRDRPVRMLRRQIRVDITLALDRQQFLRPPERFTQRGARPRLAHAVALADEVPQSDVVQVISEALRRTIEPLRLPPEEVGEFPVSPTTSPPPGPRDHQDRLGV
jgi:hypothetical protein